MIKSGTINLITQQNKQHHWRVLLISHFHARAWFQLHMSRILFALKKRNLFGGGYLQVTPWALGH